MKIRSIVFLVTACASMLGCSGNRADAGIWTGAAAQTARPIGQDRFREGQSRTTPASEEHGGVQRGATLRGHITGLEVRLVSTYAYRDWMPGIRQTRGEDGGSPLHIMIALVLRNTGQGPIALESSARLGVAGAPLEPIPLDDLATPRIGPILVAAGESRRLELGTREGPHLAVGSLLDLEIDLEADNAQSIQIVIDGLEVHRTD